MTTMTSTAGTILAVDLGKRKSIACVYSKKARPPLETITTDGVTVTVTSEGEIVNG